MMISSPSAGDPYAAAAALDRALRSPPGRAAGDDMSSDGATPDSGPDVVVTLSQGASSPSTYDASGKMSGAPTLDDMGANRPDSLAKASESVDGADATSSAPGTSARTDAANSADADASVDEDAAVPA